MASTVLYKIEQSHHNHNHHHHQRGPGKSVHKGRCHAFRATTTMATTKRRANISLTFVIALIILAPTQRPAGLMRGGVTLVSAYLDNLGQISSAMSDFVEALLEKVSFLAEIIIDSSMAEQCELNCPSESDRDADEFNFNKSSMEHAQRLASSDNGLISRPAEKGTKQEGYAKRAGWPIKPKREFDANEFTNVALFIDTLKKRQQKRQTSGGASCRLFNLIDVGRQDLPVADMELCCRQFDDCYKDCAKEKLACDAEFQLCFKSLCRDKFDFRNESLVYHYDRNHQSDANEDQEDLELDLTSASEREEGNTITTEHQQPTAKQVKRVKDKYKACKLASKVLIIGNLAFGCQAYKEAQRSVCCKRTSL